VRQGKCSDRSRMLTTQFLPVDLVKGLFNEFSLFICTGYAIYLSAYTARTGGDHHKKTIKRQLPLTYSYCFMIKLILISA
jgi:hypothetical protein